MGIVTPIAAATAAMGAVRAVRAVRAMRAMGDMRDMMRGAMGAWVMTEVEAAWRSRGAPGRATEAWRHPLKACESGSQ